MSRMFTRRFLLLAGVVVALNVTLWLAAPGLALRPGIVHELFGRKMIRAEVVQKNGADWRLDRGVITQATSTQLTLREADGRIQSIPLSASTKVRSPSGRRLPAGVLAPRWRVLVTWPASGTAQSVDVERIPRGHGKRGIG